MLTRRLWERIPHFYGWIDTIKTAFCIKQCVFRLKVGTSAKLLFSPSTPFTSILLSLTSCLQTSRPSVHKTNHFRVSAHNVSKWCKCVYHFSSRTLKVLLCCLLWRRVTEQRAPVCFCVRGTRQRRVVKWSLLFVKFGASGLCSFEVKPVWHFKLWSD